MGISLSGAGGGTLRSWLSENPFGVCVHASEQKATGEMKDPGPAAGWTVREAGLARSSVKIG